jgi:hypothetical protein
MLRDKIATKLDAPGQPPLTIKLHVADVPAWIFGTRYHRREVFGDDEWTSSHGDHYVTRGGWCWSLRPSSSMGPSPRREIKGQPLEPSTAAEWLPYPRSHKLPSLSQLDGDWS